MWLKTGRRHLGSSLSFHMDNSRNLHYVSDQKLKCPSIQIVFTSAHSSFNLNICKIFLPFYQWLLDICDYGKEEIEKLSSSSQGFYSVP